MTKRIFSILVSLLMITSLVGIANAETPVTDGQIYHIDLADYFNSDSIASEGDKLDTATWNSGDKNNYGFPGSLFTAADGYVTFSGRNAVKIDPNGEVITSNMTVSNNSDDNFVFYIPQSGLKGGALDSVYQSKNEEVTYDLNQNANAVNKIKFALHMFNYDSTITAKVTYSDGTADSYTQYFQGSARNADSNKVVWSIYNLFRAFGWRWTESSIIPNSEGVAEESTAGGTNYYWGLRGYEIPVDATKAPVSLTLSATNPIALFALSECEMTNAELTKQLDIVRAYESGAYTTEQLNNIELANKYADVLVSRNAVTESEISDIKAIYAKAQKQKVIADVTHYNISDEYDADTIGAVGESTDETWFDGYTKLDGNFGGFPKSAFGTKEYFNALTFVKTADGKWANGDTVTAYMPNVGRDGGEVDSVALWKNKSLTVDLNNIPTKTIRYLANYSKDAAVTATIVYEDGTTQEIRKASTTYASLRYGNARDTAGAFLGAGWKLLISKDNKIDYYNKDGDQTAGIVLYSVDCDAEKSVDKVIFKADYEDRPVYFYSVSQVPVYAAEMLEKIETAKALETKTGIFTAEEIQTVKEALAYVDTLVSAGIGTQADYAFLTSLNENAQKQSDILETSHFDISKYYNADTIGAVGQTAGDNWFDGFTGFSGNFNGFNAAVFGAKELFDATEYTLNASGNLEKTGTVPVYVPNVGRNAGENDSLALWKGKTLTVDLKNIPTKSIRYLANNSETIVKIKVYYTDGTTEETEKGGTNYASTYYSLKSTNVAYLGLTGGFTVKGTDSKLTSQEGSAGLIFYNIPTDNSKIVDKAEFTVESETKPVFFYSVSQVPVLYDEMAAALDAEFAGVYTEEDEVTATALANYKETLINVGAIASTDYPMVENYTKQANSQKNTYVDLTEYLNDDIMVKAGDDYSNITLGRTTELFDGAKIPSDGIITMQAPGDTALISSETGRTYKLSGAYTGKGNDSILIKSTDEKGVTIAVPSANGKIKGMGVILETNGGIDGSGVEVPAIVTYSDNTKNSITVLLQKSQGYNTRRNNAAAGNYNRMRINENGIAENVKIESGTDSLYLYSSNIEFDLDKTVSSITFMPYSKDDYHIVAMTEYVYSNQELLDNFDAMPIEVVAPSDITLENADSVILGSEAVIELFERGFTADFTQEDCEAFTQLLNYARALKSGDVKLDISVAIAEDGDNMRATATMTNTTLNPQNYVIVIAAYKGNKLVGLNISAQGTVNSGDAGKTDGVSLGKIEGAEYKAFVWESVSSLKPIAKAN